MILLLFSNREVLLAFYIQKQDYKFSQLTVSRNLNNPSSNRPFSTVPLVKRNSTLNVNTIHSILHLSLVLRKPVFGVSDQVSHKPVCTVTEDGEMLEISDLGIEGLYYPCTENKGAYQLRGYREAGPRS